MIIKYSFNHFINQYEAWTEERGYRIDTVGVGLTGGEAIAMARRHYPDAHFHSTSSTQRKPIPSQAPEQQQ